MSIYRPTMCETIIQLPQAVAIFFILYMKQKRKMIPVSMCESQKLSYDVPFPTYSCALFLFKAIVTFHCWQLNYNICVKINKHELKKWFIHIFAQARMNLIYHFHIRGNAGIFLFKNENKEMESHSLSVNMFHALNY